MGNKDLTCLPVRGLTTLLTASQTGYGIMVEFWQSIL
jgi:hypothetical protein